MKAVICAIAKNENSYINNWCNYHLNLGFDHIYLFDNNDSKTKNIASFINKDTKSKITIFNVNDIHKPGFQSECYTKFYTENNKTFDWCAFIDIDEFIDLPIKDIKLFLNNQIFSNYEVIRLKWHLYGDDDVISRDEAIPVQKFFKKQLLDNKFSNFSKSIIRGNLKNITIKSSHYGVRNDMLLTQCNSIGLPVDDIYIVEPHQEAAWINHYMTKTLKEFLKQKYNRTDCQFKDKQLKLQYFWSLNKKTKAKELFIKQYLENKKKKAPKPKPKPKKINYLYF